MPTLKTVRHLLRRESATAPVPAAPRSAPAEPSAAGDRVRLAERVRELDDRRPRDRGAASA